MDSINDENTKASNEYKSKRSSGLENLICEMLRGPHTKNLAISDLRAYTELAGIALHNLPHCVASKGPLMLYQLLSVNDLDPGAPDQGWGEWILSLCESFSQEVPVYPIDHERQFEWCS